MLSRSSRRNNWNRYREMKLNKRKYRMIKEIHISDYLLTKLHSRWSESETTWSNSCCTATMSVHCCMRRSGSSNPSWARETSTTTSGWMTYTCWGWRLKGSGARRVSWTRLYPTERTWGNRERTWGNTERKAGAVEQITGWQSAVLWENHLL